MGRPHSHVTLGAAAFLDRDGVVNRAHVRNGRPYSPVSPAELEILPDVPETIRALSAAGLRVIVATNQPDVATGKQRRQVVEAMHRRLLRELAIDDIRVCYHVDADCCDCRKPKPGMLFAAAREWRVDLGRSFMVGDRWRDIAAGRAAGCTTFLVDRGYDEERPAEAPDYTVASLAEAGRIILALLARRGEEGKAPCPIS
ncbi:MAG: D-glycero-alpha-D-manno-heptose-1,7-bisphosphate 7-phosphatase [Pseudomonadota bacterium]